MNNKTKYLRKFKIPRHVGIIQRVVEWLNDSGLKSKYNKDYTIGIVTNVIHNRYEDLNVELALAEVMRIETARQNELKARIKEVSSKILAT